MTTSVRSLNMPFRTLVIRSDPDWPRERRKGTEYEFSNGRKFEAVHDERGAYTPEE